MPLLSPFHERIAPLCVSYRFKDWAGYVAPCAYGDCHESEYYAIRHAAGLLDVTPLFKYEVRGPDAGRFLARVMVRDIRKLKIGRVTYCCWCDDDGKVVDDGTVSRLDEEHYRVTAAEPTLRWLQVLSRGFNVEIQDVTANFGVLAIQGPTSRDVLRRASDADLDKLKFFGTTACKIDGVDARISRTGYTGDLGYEVWVEAKDANRLWDALFDAGRDYNLRPVGLDALDMTRIEAGFVLLDVDYFSAPTCILESRKSTPDEIGLDWCVNLEREPFIGQSAIRAERARGSKWRLVGLELSWEALEALYDRNTLPPNLPAAADRNAVPVYSDGRQVGQVTSSVWSPILKKSVALASVYRPFSDVGTQLDVEHTVEYHRDRVSAEVIDRPFFDPERKRKP